MPGAPGAITQRRDRRGFFLLAYLFCNHFAATPIHSVSPRILFRDENFVEPVVYERNRAIIFNRDSGASGLSNHLPESPSPRDSPGLTAVMGTVYSLYQSQAPHIYVLPFSGVVKRHRIGMPGIKPADRSCTNPGKHRPVLVRRYQKLVDTQAPPKAHHQQSISAANINNVR